MNIEIKLATDKDAIIAAKKLFREYEKWLGFDLCFQGFEAELAGLPGKYASPEGRLYIAYGDGTALGCIAMRKISDDVCEMKRLYVREAGRGQGLGRMFIEKVVTDARECGYRLMRLDTYPLKMGKAVELYKQFGFREIDAYYDNPFEGVLFMEKDLES